MFCDLAEGGFPPRPAPDPVLLDGERKLVAAACGARLPGSAELPDEHDALFALARDGRPRAARAGPPPSRHLDRPSAAALAGAARPRPRTRGRPRGLRGARHRRRLRRRRAARRQRAGRAGRSARRRSRGAGARRRQARRPARVARRLRRGGAGVGAHRARRGGGRRPPPRRARSLRRRPFAGQRRARRRGRVRGAGLAQRAAVVPVLPLRLLPAGTCSGCRCPTSPTRPSRSSRSTWAAWPTRSCRTPTRWPPRRRPPSRDVVAGRARPGRRTRLRACRGARPDRLSAVVARRLRGAAGRPAARGGGRPLLGRRACPGALRVVVRPVHGAGDARRRLVCAAGRRRCSAAAGRRRRRAAPELLVGDRVVRFRGRIDRLDESPDGRRVRLVDYKTGKGTTESERVGAGRDVQLPVYVAGPARQRRCRPRESRRRVPHGAPQGGFCQARAARWARRGPREPGGHAGDRGGRHRRRPVPALARPRLCLLRRGGKLRRRPHRLRGQGHDPRLRALLRFKEPAGATPEASS